MRPYRKTTIKDVALRAGVSVSTVSMFVSGREELFAAETGARIRQAVADLHYVPSAHTRSLRPRATRTIGICATPPHLQPQYSYMERLWYGFMQAADEQDYSLHHYPMSVREGVAYTPFLDGLVDGLIINADGNDLRPARIAEAGLPLVLTDRSLDLPEGCGCVYADERDTVSLALAHLWERGHRRIAHLHGPINAPATPSGSLKALSVEGNSAIAVRRREAYQAWMQERNAFDPRLLCGARVWWQVEADVRETVRGWLALDAPPTAVFCANDVLARGIIAILQADGVAVPQQISVVGVDNDALCSGNDPPLTTVDVSAESIGREAVRTLLRLMQGEPASDCRSELRVSRPVERGSTAARRPSDK